MEGRNVIYMTPEEVRNLDKSQIASMTMTSGDVLIINNDSVMEGDEFAEENVINQESYELTSKVPGQNYILRTKKEKTVEEGEGGVEKIEEKVEIEVEPQPETEANQNGEVLRGPDGRPLLNDILTGGDVMEQEQPQNEQQPMAGQVGENVILVPQEGQYYEQPGVSEQNVDMNNNAYNEQYYPSEEPNNEDVNYNQNVQDQYLEPNYDVPQEGYPNEQNQYYPQEQPMNVPEEQQGYYPEDQPQPQDYQQPMNVPQEQQGYYPQEQPLPQQPMNVPQEQQGYYPGELPPEQEPLEPPSMPVNEPPLQEPVQPPTQVPVQAPVQPSTQVPVQAPVQPPTQVPVQAPIQPPAKQPMQPPVQPNIPNQQMPGAPKGKVFIPSHQAKVPKVQMTFGINTPKVVIGMGKGLPKQPFVPMGHHPHGPMGHHPHGPMGHPVHRPMVNPPHAMGFIPPVQQKKIVIVGPRGVAQAKVAKQIGAMMNAVNKVMTPMVGISAKRVGLRSTKPTTTQKEDVKQENVLRARRKDVNNYDEQQEEVLCPECANEEYLAQSGQFTGTGFSDNYTFHEIVETSDNSKSYVVAKKGGITVSSDY